MHRSHSNAQTDRQADGQRPGKERPLAVTGSTHPLTIAPHYFLSVISLYRLSSSSNAPTPGSGLRVCNERVDGCDCVREHGVWQANTSTDPPHPVEKIARVVGADLPVLALGAPWLAGLIG